MIEETIFYGGDEGVDGKREGISRRSRRGEIVGEVKFGENLFGIRFLRE